MVVQAAEEERSTAGPLGEWLLALRGPTATSQQRPFPNILCVLHHVFQVNYSSTGKDREWSGLSPVCLETPLRRNGG